MTYRPTAIVPGRRPVIAVGALFVYFLAALALNLLFGEEVAAVFAIIAVAVTIAVNVRK